MQQCTTSELNMWKVALQVAAVGNVACIFLLHAEHSSGLLRGFVLGIILFPCRRNQLIPHPSKGKSRGLRHMDNWSQHHAGHQSDHTPYSSCYASALVLSIHNLGNISHSSTHSLIRGNATDHFKLGWNEAGTCLNPLHRQLPGCNTLEFNLLRHGFRVPIMQNSEVSIMYLHVEILPIAYRAYTACRNGQQA